MTNKIEPDAEERQKHITSLVNRCIDFVDRNGHILMKEVSPMISVLVLEYKEQDFVIKLLLTGGATPNGACSVEVKYKDKVVFETKGRHMEGVAYDIFTITYIPGEWEKKIPEILQN